jgi:DNA-binding MarR family transcriptional regulator
VKLPDVRHPVYPEKHLPHRLISLSNRLERHGSNVYASQRGLTFAEWRVLGVVATLKQISSIDIASSLGLDKAAVSRTVAVLLRRGLIERHPDPTDRRRLVLTPTVRGAHLHDEIAPQAIARDKRLRAALTVAQRREIDAIVDTLSAEVERMLEEGEDRKV